MRIGHDEGRDAFVATTTGFLTAVDGLDDETLLNASYCRGWCLVDVVVHVQQGLAEVARGLLSLRAGDDREPDCDALTYWRSQFAEPGADPVAAMLQGRRLGSAFRRPRLAVRQLRDTAEPVVAAAHALPTGRLNFQGQVLATGDFWASWAVELAVHQLDLTRETPVASPHRSGLTLARRTVEALLGAELPGDDRAAVLLGAGRRPSTAEEAAVIGPDTDRPPVQG